MQYPATYNAHDGSSVEGDSNLLLHGEEGSEEEERGRVGADLGRWESGQNRGRASSGRHGGGGRGPGMWGEQEASI